jgi:uncharacterized protein YndB with AHSA1/START domain
MSASTTAAPDAVTAEVEIAAPPARVFAALTDPRQLAGWWGREPSVELVACEMDARPGGRWRCRWKPRPGTAQGAVHERLAKHGADEYEAHGEIVTVEPPHRLVWTWIANWHEDPAAATQVRWELTPTAAGTRVRVIHSGLIREPIARADYTDGWIGVLSLLRGHFAT